LPFPHNDDPRRGSGRPVDHEKRKLKWTLSWEERNKVTVSHNYRLKRGPAGLAHIEPCARDSKDSIRLTTV